MKKLLLPLMLFSIFIYADDNVTSFSNANINSYLNSHDKSIVDNTNVFDGKDITAQVAKEPHNAQNNTATDSPPSSSNVVVVENTAPNNNQNQQQYNNSGYYPYYYPYAYNNYDYNNQQTYTRLQAANAEVYNASYQAGRNAQIRAQTGGFPVDHGDFGNVGSVMSGAGLSR